jgi:hypothetical protein
MGEAVMDAQYNRFKWLSELKEGEIVAVEIFKMFEGQIYQIATIEHITPKRNRFDTSEGSFDKFGVQSAGKWSHSNNIVPLSEEIAEKILIRKYKWVIERAVGAKDVLDKLSKDQLQQIAEIIQSVSSKKGGQHV